MSRKPLTPSARCLAFLAFVTAGLAVVAGTAGAQVTNLNTSANYTTIQAAVDAAIDGHVIEVTDGTYVENVNLNKNITLQSENGRAVTTIQGISSAGALGAITVTGNTTGAQIGAVGKGFTILGIDNGLPGIENAAVYFQGSHSNAQILDNEVVAQGDHGLLTEYGATISGFVIDGNEFSGATFLGPNPAGNGFSQQFTLPNVPRQLVVMGGSGGVNTSNVTFTNNQVTGTAGGLNIAAEEQGNTLVTIDSNGATITGNTFAGVTSRFATSLRTRGPATTVSGNNFDSSGIDWPLKATGHHYIQNTGTSSAAVVALNTYDKVVNVDAPVTTIGFAIQPFVSAVPGGTTIEVGPGTYTEQVVIDGKDLTLQGAGAGSSIIESPATLVSTYLVGTTTNYPVVTAANSPNIVISGFTVDGLGNGNVHNRFQGVAFWNGGGALLDCHVTRIRDTPASGAQHGVAIYSFNDTGGPYALEVGNCLVDDFQKNAMALSGDGMVVDVHDCTTIGAGDIAYTAQNGIQISFGAGGSVTDCNVSALRYTPATWVASGLLAYACGSPLTTSGNNVFTACQAPVNWYDTDGTCSGIENPDGTDYDAIFVYNSTALRSTRERPLPEPLAEPSVGGRAPVPFTVVVSDGCLTGTGLAGTSGVWATAGVGTLDLTVTGMSITNYDIGLVLDGAAVTCVANDNSIAGNVSAGLDNSLSGNAVDAELNWWGAADGPSGAGPGTGDAIVGPAVDFDPFRVDGTSTTVCGFTPLPNTIEPNPASGICISTATPCVAVPMDISRTDNEHARGYSVTFTLSPELELCAGTASITQGTYLSSIGGTNFQVIDNTGGSYTVDCAILGVPCGQTAATGNLFNLDVQAAGGDGSGTITVDSVLLRDCNNVPLAVAPGAAAILPIDTAGPAAIADLGAAQVKSLNDADGTTKVTVDFTVPGDADEVLVYRKGYGDYPEYDDGTGAVPTLPATPAAAVGDGWELTGVTATGQTDETTVRDYWYYVVFTKDACDNVSAVSNMTGGTLNYHLGDVSNGTTPGQGDNLVATADMSLLGSNYGIAIGFGSLVNYLDVGPTDDFSVNGLPTTDNLINFEDLILFAINFGQVSAPRLAPVPAGESALFQPAIALEVSQEGEVTVARLSLVDNPDHVKGIHAFVSLGGLEVVSAETGSLVRTQGAPVFFETLPAEGGVWVDLALLGRDLAFEGSGEIAVLTLSGDGAAQLGDVVLRDRKNRDASRRPVDSDPPAPEQTTSVEATGLPSRVELAAARPNPFGSSTEILFRLPASAQVSLTVHDVTGRLVRTLVDRTVGAGEMSVSWDGRTNGGDLVGAGIYFYTLQAGDHRETRKLLRVN